ncbi:MAG: uracil-DNA glycosylase [Nitrosomonas sp.]|nr:uracil-DNA glycosylase [Nitrospira sp. CR1.2]TXI23038.1 MAG: uracil-DNA glycosylase [Nitrosomonas sp.]
MLPPVPSSWKQLLSKQLNSLNYRDLELFLDQEAVAGEVILPGPRDIYAALRETRFDDVKVLLLGQDPYPTPGMAHGLSFSIPSHIRSFPPSLKNIYKELQDDLGCRIPNNGCLEPWARQGVLLLNTVLTVRAHSANSHRRRGWESITDRIIEVVNEKPVRVVYVLWGEEAKKKRGLITNPQHVVITCAHPSPLSVRKFFGSRCFSQVNKALMEAGIDPINWQIPDV